MTLQTCVPKKLRLCRWGAEQWVKHAQTRERGSPSAPAEFFNMTNTRYANADTFDKYRPGGPMSKWIMRLFLLGNLRIAHPTAQPITGGKCCFCYAILISDESGKILLHIFMYLWSLVSLCLIGVFVLINQQN